MQVEDHFSGHAVQYGRSRPDYPDALFQRLAAMSPDTSRAWDCATGNGQAAHSLAKYFDAVFATDVSFEQIRQAERVGRVHRHVAAAEASAIADRVIDLVVVAQALHWFDIHGFVEEVRRVLKNEGVFAAWCYPGMHICPDVDERIASFYRYTVGPYWPAERRHIESGYRTLDLPLVEEALPSFYIDKQWDLKQVADYVRSWSATRRYMREHGNDPVDVLTERLREVWGHETDKRRVRWPLVVRAGRLA